MSMKQTSALIFLAFVLSISCVYAADHGSADGVKTEPGMKPFAWPKRLVSLEFGKEVRYRDTAYKVLAFLQDGDAYLQVKQGDGIVAKLSLFDGGQFGILDVDSPMPMLEGWGERYDKLGCRWLIVPVRGKNSTKYEMAYIEFYSPNKVEALASDAHEVQLRPTAKKRVVYFLGHHTQYSKQQASERLNEAIKLP